MIKLVILILAISFGLTNCKANKKQGRDNNMYQVLKKENPIQRFWNWFEDNETRIRNFEENPDKYLDMVLHELNNIQKELAITISPIKNGVIEMTISADGDKGKFEKVFEIVNAAPKLKGWKFSALKQRIDLDSLAKITIEAAGFKLNLDKMKYEPILYNDTLDLIIYIEGFIPKQRDEISYLGLLLMDKILGEKDFALKVNKVEFVKMNPNRKSYSMSQLPKFVDNLK